MNNNKNKIVLLGDAAVGKTSLIIRWTSQKFENSRVPTIGASYVPFFITNSDGTQQKIELWDTAGTELFRSVVPMYSRGSIGAFIVFDLTKKESFLNISNWIKLLPEKIPIMIIGNKLDLNLNREINFEDVNNYCKLNDFLYFEVSALTGEGVDESFLTLINKCIIINPNTKFITSNNLNNKKNCC